MKVDMFKKLPESISNNVCIGHIFLEGENMIAQKQTKNVGDSITYFEIIEITESGYEYVARYETLEK